MLLVIGATVAGLIFSFALCWWVVFRVLRPMSPPIRVVLLLVCGTAMSIITAALIIAVFWPPYLWGQW